MNTTLVELLKALGQMRSTMKLHVVPYIVTNHGVQLSVQASKFHMCLPKEDYRPEYVAYEVMILGQKEVVLPEGFQPHTIDGYLFGYVPLDKLEKLVNHFGGLCFNRTLQSINDFAQHHNRGIIL